MPAETSSSHRYPPSRIAGITRLRSNSNDGTLVLRTPLPLHLRVAQIPVAFVLVRVMLLDGSGSRWSSYPGLCATQRSSAGQSAAHSGVTIS